MTIVCPYDARLLSPDVLADAEATHPILIDPALIDTVPIDAAVERPSPRYRPDEVLATYDTPLTDSPVDASTHEVSVWDLSAARRLVAGQASECGLPPLRVADVALVAGELLANRIEHGAGTATLCMWSTDTALVCQVEGTARWTNPLAGRIPAPPGQHRGRGLLIVNRLADLVRTHSRKTGTTIRAYFTPTSGPDLDKLIQTISAGLGANVSGVFDRPACRSGYRWAWRPEVPVSSRLLPCGLWGSTLMVHPVTAFR